MTPGQLIRRTREARGISQARLARRVGTRQSAISRLEQDEISPSVETLEKILNAMGMELELGTRPMDSTHDPLHHAEMMKRTPAERLALAASWNRLAGELTASGKKAKQSQ